MNLRALAACAALLSLPACSGDTTATGVVRVLNSIQGPATVDLLLDGQVVVGSIAFPGSSGYQSLPVGPHTVGVLDPATSRLLAQVSVPLAAGEGVTVLASGIPGGSPATTATVFLDDDSLPATGFARLRVVHGAAASATLVLEATLLPEGSSAAAVPSLVVPYRTAEYFLEVPAGRYALAIVDAVTLAPVATFPTGALPAGSVTTALVSDAAPGAAVPVRLAYFADLP